MNKTKKLPISIVIPAKNEEKNISRLLNEIDNQVYKPKEVIIADAGSEDRTRDIAKEYDAIIVNGGIPSIGRNNGAKAASEEYILFIDADIHLISRTFLRDIYIDFLREGIDCGTCYFKPNRYFKDWKGYTMTWVFNRIKDLSSFIPSKFIKFEWGILIFTRKDVFINVNGFREDMPYLEDCKFISDLVGLGYKYKVLKRYIEIDLSRELKGSFAKNFRVSLAAIIGAVFLVFSKDSNNSIYSKITELYRSGKSQ